MLPITKVVLYKHGVGYFERQGQVRGDASIDLHFKAAEMNDVLKSLTTLDLTSGIISSISYEAMRPVEKQLEEVSLRIPDDASLSGLLSQVKGAHVAVEIGSRTVEGTVLGIEQVNRRTDQGTDVLITNRLALLCGGDTLMSFDLAEVRGIKLADESLRKDLAHLLEILVGATKKDLKKLTIFARGEGERTLFASYVVETPVWKTSYRMLLDGDKPLIQGWALVDNTQDEDWEGVQLSLVAGLPISFVHDLYAPRYKRRPVVRVKEEEAYAPPQLESAIGGYAESAPMMMGGMAGGGPPGGFAPPPMPASAPAPRPQAARREAMQRQAPEVVTRTVEAGDLFHYDIKNAVTVKRGQSALVPILQSGFEGKRVAVYNKEVSGKNPMSAVLFKNTTGMTLEGGPVTVLEDGSYVGEAMLDTTKPGEERLVPFSVELGCVITLDHKSETETVRFVRIVNGHLYAYRYRIERKIYIVHNKSERPLDLFLEHRITHGWQLASPEKPVEQTENFYRFRFPVPAKETLRYVVAEKGDQTESFGLVDLREDQLRLWIESKYLDARVAGELTQLMTEQAEIARLARRLAEAEREIAAIFQNQERLRQNLSALGASEDERGLRERYVKELSQEEDKLRELRDGLARMKQEKERRENEVRARIGAFTYERTV